MPEVNFTAPYSRTALSSILTAAQNYATSNGLYLWRTLENLNHINGKLQLSVLANYESQPSEVQI